MKPEKLFQWFTEELLPTVVENGKFADRKDTQTLESCEFEEVEKYVNSFASVACFAKFKLKTLAGTVTRDVLIKFQSQDPLFRNRMRTVPQFINEVALYNEVYPSFVEFLKSCGKTPDFVDRILPKCYFASTGDGDVEKAVLILNDLRGDGFRLSDSATDLNLKHILISVERLAEFHGISYAMKFKCNKQLDQLKTSFAEVLLEDVPECREQWQDFSGYVSNRGIEYLLAKKDTRVPREYLEKLRRMLKPIFELMKSLINPTEPLSVICHGDFNRNNILYRYVDGEVADAKLIDFQRVFYGSPSLDLGFLIYMNTTLAFREKYFDQVFEHYYRNLIRRVSEILNEAEKHIEERLPIQAFKEDFEKVAVWHYVIVSFFLPLMMTPPDPDFESDLKKSFREMAEKNYKTGGDEVNERIAEVIVDFYKRKFYV